MDLSTLAPQLAALIGVQPSTLVLLVVIVMAAAKAVGRVIPDDATGFLGYVRRICSVISVDVANRVTTGVTTDQVAREAATTPPINEKIAAETGIKPVDPAK